MAGRFFIGLFLIVMDIECIATPRRPTLVEEGTNRHILPPQVEHLPRACLWLFLVRLTVGFSMMRWAWHVMHWAFNVETMCKYAQDIFLYKAVSCLYTLNPKYSPSNLHVY